VNELTWVEEVFFYRLIVNCDDYGRMDARPAIIKARLFPLKDITLKQIGEILNKLVMVGMVMVYEYDQRPYLQLVTWGDHQQIRNKKSKFPSPDVTCNQLISNASNCPRNPIQSESNPNTNPNPTPAAADENVKRIVELFHECKMGEINGMIAETITEIVDKHPMELIEEAFRLAGLKNARSIKYPSKILENWKAKGITTIDGARMEQTEATDKGLNKKLDFGKFPQHQYSEDQLNSLFEQIGDKGESN
jgi:DnaD/phage-associated family protein